MHARSSEAGDAASFVVGGGEAGALVRSMDWSATALGPPADDEADARDLVATVLRTHGAEVATVSSVEQALELLAKGSPRVLVSDIGMPGADGYELIRRLRALAIPSAQVPAIALTAYAREEDRRRAIEAGFQTHVAKPVEPDELVRVVAGLAQAVRAARS
jgi:CheY-like chemotaxis protein